MNNKTKLVYIPKEVNVALDELIKEMKLFVKINESTHNGLKKEQKLLLIQNFLDNFVNHNVFCGNKLKLYFRISLIEVNNEVSLSIEEIEFDNHEILSQNQYE